MAGPAHARKRATATRPVPNGWHTVTPRIFADGAEQLVRFVRDVFEATGEYRESRPTELRIGDSIVMITDTAVRRPTPAFLYVYVVDADATYQRALEAGATSLEPPSDMPYGDRRGMVEDQWGNVWQIATHRSEPPRRPVKRRRPAHQRRRGSSGS